MHIRRSQLIVPFGVGAILNMPNESLMLCSIDKWDEYAGEKIFDERLQKYIGVKYFKMPASLSKYPKGLPFIRFPRWLNCPNCRTLKPLEEWENRWVSLKHEEFEFPVCYVCGANLNPARFIIACEKGHINDFPWVHWAHGDGKCSNPDLTLESGRGIAGLGGIKIKCKTCNSERTMAGSFNRDVFTRIIKLKCDGSKPWQGVNNDQCEEMPVTLQRGASNVYFPQLVSSICIPPYSDDICSEIQKTDEWKVLYSQADGVTAAFKDELIKLIARKVNISLKEVAELITRMLSSSTGSIERRSDTEYRYDEYRAFLGDIKTGEIDSKNFSIEIVDGKQYGINSIKKVVLAHRLREIRALIAFNRINPIEKDLFGDTSEENTIERHPMPITEKANTEWLPAMEIRGEGIFIEFNFEAIKQWLNNDIVKKRVSLINRNFLNLCRTSGREPKSISPSFVLLHTFAHILMRQLSFECGYSTASLRERIYCNEPDNKYAMSGVLIYTASGDSEGSMGGLVRQGRTDKLSNIIAKAIKHAAWCSSDPACVESNGQGLGALNLAACYACVLLPETSCEINNRFLDRAMLIGLPDKSEIGFFHSLV